MSLSKVSHFLEKIAGQVSRAVMGIGAGIIVVMMFLTTADVSGRYLLNRPIPGVFEVTSFMLLLVVCLGLAYTQVKKGHIFVDLVVSRFPQRAQAAIDSAVYLLCLGLFSLIAWQGVQGAQTQWRAGIVSGVLDVPLYPFYFVLVFGCALLSFVFLVDFLDSVRRVVSK